MSDLRELYQQVILDHNKSPRNFRKIENPTGSIEGFNPLCGDHIHVYVTVEDDRIQDVAFEGSGCAISKASASLMTSALIGKTKEEAEALFEQFHNLLTTDGSPDMDQLGKLAVFSGVREYPTRVKCATLAWHTAKAAISGQIEAITTE